MDAPPTSPDPGPHRRFSRSGRRLRMLAVLGVVLGLTFSSARIAHADTFLDADFDAGNDGFLYVDDPFRSTSQPAYASGTHLPTGGETGGGLQVLIGGIDSATINGMSGGFTRTFTLPTTTENVEIQFHYDLIQAADYESDEFSQAIVSLDGVPLAGAGPDYVAQLIGNGNGGGAQSTGWTPYSIDLGEFMPGVYTLTIGGYNNKKTFDNETTTILIDDVLVTGTPVLPCLVDLDCDDANPCTNDVCDLSSGSGSCANPPNANPCDDGLACTGGDVCSAGACGGTDLCPGDQTCQPIAGLCEEPAAQPLVDALSLQGFKDAIEDLSSSDPPINGSRHWSQPGNAAALDYLEATLASYGYAVERHAYTYSSQTRENVFVTKVGSVRPDEMVIVSAHMDSVNADSPGSVFAPGANDDASGTALVLEAARVFADPAVESDRSIRFILWNNEETGLNGSSAYVADRRALQGVESPPGSGLYPEPTWVAVITHDQLLWDHGLPSGPTQSPTADIDIEFQASSSFAAASQALGEAINQANIDYAPAYPSEVTNDMCCTDSVPFQNDVAAVSVRDNRRRAEIGNGSNPTWHRDSDVFATYSEADFALGFSAVQATVGAVAEIVNARLPSTCGNGVLDPGEACDDGNFLGGDCCSVTCEIEPAGTVCRSALGVCDAEEVCDGLVATCPADLKRSDECRAAAGACDVPEVCDGTGDSCPPDLFVGTGVSCRVPADVCDAEEVCSGFAATCPSDSLLPAATECRPALGQCDVAESCTGADITCPPDSVLDGVLCVDGDTCTTGDLCVAGVCFGATSLDCDDGDVCTADSCDAVTGCGHEVIAGCGGAPGVDSSTALSRFLLLLALVTVASAVAFRRADPS